MDFHIERLTGENGVRWESRVERVLRHTGDRNLRDDRDWFGGRKALPDQRELNKRIQVSMVRIKQYWRKVERNFADTCNFWASMLVLKKVNRTKT